MKYYILATRVNLDGYPEQLIVGYDNKPADDFDEILLFDSEEEAQAWIDSDATKEWYNCDFNIVKFIYFEG